MYGDDIRKVKRVNVRFAEERSGGILAEIVDLVLAGFRFVLHHCAGMMSRVGDDKVVRDTVFIHESANSHRPRIAAEARHEPGTQSEPCKPDCYVHLRTGNAGAEVRYIGKRALFLGEQKLHRFTYQQYLIHSNDLSLSYFRIFPLKSKKNANYIISDF